MTRDKTYNVIPMGLISCQCRRSVEPAHLCPQQIQCFPLAEVHTLYWPLDRERTSVPTNECYGSGGNVTDVEGMDNGVGR